MLRPGPTDAFEDIYLKRHIAAGIPTSTGAIGRSASRRPA